MVAIPPGAHMDFNYLTVLWRRKWIILTAALAALGVVYIGGRSAVTVYESTAVLRIAIYASASQTPALYNYNDELTNTFVRVALSTSVRRDLAERLQTDHLPDIQVDTIEGTELVLVRASDPNPELTVRAANTLAEILVEQGRALYSGSTVDVKNILAGQLERAKADLDAMRADYETLIVRTPPVSDEITLVSQLLQEKQRTYETLLRQYEQAEYREALETGIVSLVEYAPPNPVASQQNRIIFYLLALSAGAAVGVFAAFLVERFDTRLYATREIEMIVNAPSLANFPSTSRAHLQISRNGISPLANTVRNLAATLQIADGWRHHKIILLTGAEPGQGVTTTAANLGSALTEQGRKVLLVDCNLRDPKLNETFDLPNDKGLINVLAGNAELEDAIQRGEDGQPALLSTGPVSDSASLLVTSSEIEPLFKTIRHLFDYILIDAPAVPFAETANIAAHADAVVLVVRRSHVRRDSVRIATDLLTRFGNKYLGLVVNESEIHSIQPFVDEPTQRRN